MERLQDVLSGMLIFLDPWFKGWYESKWKEEQIIYIVPEETALEVSYFFY